LINNNFITSQNFKTLLTKRFKTNELVKRKNTDIGKMVAVVQNVINKIAHPTQTLKTLSKAPANNKKMDVFSDITNNETPAQDNEVKIENAAVDNSTFNYSPSYVANIVYQLG
jgi:hypothetical protein